MDVGDHVPGHVSPERVAIEVEGDVGGGSSHGDTENCHAAALGHHVDGVDCGRLDINIYLRNPNTKLVWTESDGLCN